MEQNQNDSNKAMSTFWPMLILGAGVVFVLNYFEEKKPHGPEAETQAVQEQVQTQTPDNKSPALSPGKEVADFQFREGTGEFLEVDEDRYYVRLSTLGGRIDSFYIKSTPDLRIPRSVIDNSNDPIARKHSALEVTRGKGMDFQPHLYFKNPSTGDYWQVENPSLNEAVFTSGETYRNETTGQTEIRFHIPVEFKGHHLEIQKIYRFLRDEYYFHQVTAIRNLDQEDFDLNGDLFYKLFGDIGPEPTATSSRVLSTYGRFYYYNDGLNHWSSLSHSGGGMSCALTGCGNKDTGPYSVHLEAPGTLEFAGSTSRYFMGYTKFLGTRNGDPFSGIPDGIIMINKGSRSSAENFTTVFRSFHLEGSKDRENLFPEPLDRVSIARARARKDSLIIDNQVYYGVRREESHLFQNPDIASQEFGSKEPEYRARDVIYSSMFLAFFSAIRDGIVVLMRFMYGYIGNYGWVIILIAGGFKILTWSMNQMQVKSMQRMQKLKPEMDKINEKYADDPQEKQKKIMELYKKHKINPAKGCLPMLIQIPIFIALYSAFSESVELWRSPFIFWMTDLSAPDTIMVFSDLIIFKNFHLNILPLVMVGSQLLQQMTTQVSSDPQQKMMMYMMPLIMIFFFWNMPSGVTLYWSIQNIITVLWQVISQKLSSDDDDVEATA